MSRPFHPGSCSAGLDLCVSISCQQTKEDVSLYVVRRGQLLETQVFSERIKGGIRPRAVPSTGRWIESKGVRGIRSSRDAIVAQFGEMSNSLILAQAD